MADPPSLPRTTTDARRRGHQRVPSTPPRRRSPRAADDRGGRGQAGSLQHVQQVKQRGRRIADGHDRARQMRPPQLQRGGAAGVAHARRHVGTRGSRRVQNHRVSAGRRARVTPSLTICASQRIGTPRQRGAGGGRHAGVKARRVPAPPGPRHGSCGRRRFPRPRRNAPDRPRPGCGEGLAIDRGAVPFRSHWASQNLRQLIGVQAAQGGGVMGAAMADQVEPLGRRGQREVGGTRPAAALGAAADMQHRIPAGSAAPAPAPGGASRHVPAGRRARRGRRAGGCADRGGPGSDPPARAGGGPPRPAASATASGAAVPGAQGGAACRGGSGRIPARPAGLADAYPLRRRGGPGGGQGGAGGLQPRGHAAMRPRPSGAPPRSRNHRASASASCGP